MEYMVNFVFGAIEGFEDGSMQTAKKLVADFKDLGLLVEAENELRDLCGDEQALAQWLGKQMNNGFVMHRAEAQFVERPMTAYLVLDQLNFNFGFKF